MYQQCANDSHASSNDDYDESIVTLLSTGASIVKVSKKHLQSSEADTDRDYYNEHLNNILIIQLRPVFIYLDLYNNHYNQVAAGVLAEYTRINGDDLDLAQTKVRMVLCIYNIYMLNVYFVYIQIIILILQSADFGGTDELSEEEKKYR